MFREILAIVILVFLFWGDRDSGINNWERLNLILEQAVR